MFEKPKKVIHTLRQQVHVLLCECVLGYWLIKGQGGRGEGGEREGEREGRTEGGRGGAWEGRREGGGGSSTKTDRMTLTISQVAHS